MKHLLNLKSNKRKNQLSLIKKWQNQTQIKKQTLKRLLLLNKNQPLEQRKNQLLLELNQLLLELNQLPLQPNQLLLQLNQLLLNKLHKNLPLLKLKNQLKLRKNQLKQQLNKLNHNKNLQLKSDHCFIYIE
jgi:hypothetical protein